MRNPESTHDAPERGLTTEDLAHPGGETRRDDTAYPDETASPEDTAREDAAPAYPGEAAPVPGSGQDERTEATTAAEEPAPEDDGQPLIPPDDAEGYRDRWQQIQGTFVDDPRDAVRTADALVAEVIQSLAATFADHKEDLEAQWSRGEDIQTEELRVALQRYRSFFNQLLHA
ncbi:hypothetical protein [Streptomyces sp. NPDC000410]|uniref:hypothetical protein n=1 Tax=Streptomyces sp. NPDC000410 TaxID=3154254 RepID=UPI00331C230E